MRVFVVLCGLGLVACDGGGEPEMVTLYCYETLADSACYFEPDQGRGKRLLAVVDVALTRELALLRGTSEEMWGK